MKSTAFYIDGPAGQLHARRWGDKDSEQPPMLCLPPSPYSGVAYHTIAPMLAENRCVIAIDYPGYGNSSPMPDSPDIGDYAAAALAVADTISPTGAVDLLGFHTGCLVAVESALMNSTRVNRLVLVDVPFFTGQAREDLLNSMGGEKVLQADLSMLADDWSFCVSGRLEHVPLDRSFDLFVDQISAGERANAAFRAAFSYPSENRFPNLANHTYVIATKAGLYDQTLAAAKLIPENTLEELTDISVAVLEKGANQLAKAVNRLLNES